MNLEHQFLQLLLNHDFYQKHKSRVSKVVFGGQLGHLYDTIVQAHEKYTKDLTLDELKALYFTENPALSKANREAVHELLSSISELSPIDPAIGGDVLNSIWLKETARQVGEEAIKIMNGEGVDFSSIITILEQSEKAADKIELNAIPTDLDTVLQETDNGVKWTFNIPTLAAKVPGIGPGHMSIIFARPEVGKTGFYTGLVAGPGGFAEQGAKCLVLGNEEPMVRTMARAISACTGMVGSDIRENRAKAKELWDKIRGNITFLDDVEMSIERLEDIVAQTQPDIVIADQLDAVKIQGTFSRTDELLKALYVRSRYIAKKYLCSFIAISQCSAEGEGKRVLDMSQLDNSRTGKPATADLVIGIGKSPMTEAGVDDLTRTLNLCKNKINGVHGLVHAMLNSKLSRYEA